MLTKPTVKGLMRTKEGEELLRKLCKDALQFLESGKGKFSGDRSFDKREPTFGQPMKVTSSWHRFIRRDLSSQVAFFQALLWLLDRLTDPDDGLIQDVDQKTVDILLDEANKNRSFMMLNDLAKAQEGMTRGVFTLTETTVIAVTNTNRNRKRIKEVVAPVFDDFALWNVKVYKDDRVEISAGPFLVMIAEEILGPYFDGGEGVS